MTIEQSTTVPASSWISRPARGYSWEPFTAGNVAARKHGAFSARTVDPAAAALANELLDERPDLAGFPDTVLAWARCEARLAILDRWVTEHGVVDERGELRSGRWLVSLERLALQLRATLGLDPASAARLQRERAEASLSVADLAGVVEAGRRAAEGRQRVEETVLELDGVHERGVNEG